MNNNDNDKIIHFIYIEPIGKALCAFQKYLYITFTLHVHYKIFDTEQEHSKNKIQIIV